MKSIGDTATRPIVTPHPGRRSFRLANGRDLGYVDVGPPDGSPVMYFHGVPSSCVEWQMWGSDPMFQRLGVRLLAIDRPGVGSSSFQLHRRLGDWPTDVTELADGLGIGRFSVLGYSGGGPYAAACARKIPERLIHTAMVSSVAPFDLPGMLTGIAPGNVRFLMLSRQKPWLYRLLYWQLGLLAKYAPQRYMKSALSTFDAADRAAFARPEVHGAIFKARGSGRGQRLDTALVISDWNLSLDKIVVPVQLWQGDQDHNASLAMHRYLAATIPQAQSNVVRGEGHISLIVNHADDILKALF